MWKAGPETPRDWVEAFPQGPQVIAERPASVRLTRSIPKPHKQLLKQQLQFQGYRIGELYPRRTRRATAVSWLLAWLARQREAPLVEQGPLAPELPVLTGIPSIRSLDIPATCRWLEPSGDNGSVGSRIDRSSTPLARPVVAIIGRPNVGKSTLVNRLCRSREAIVHDEPGVTRDRTYQDGYWGDREFKVVDTGGLVFDDDSEFLPEIREQAALAMEEASVAVVIVDGQQGITAADESIAEFLRSRPCPTLLAVNKCESPEQGLAMAAEFWSLGLGEPHPISAIHGVGTGDLLDQVLTFLPPKDEEGEEEEPIQMAIIGRPNVGKSSLLNAICGEQRAIVSPIRGTTRTPLTPISFARIAPGGWSTQLESAGGGVSTTDLNSSASTAVSRRLIAVTSACW